MHSETKLEQLVILVSQAHQRGFQGFFFGSALGNLTLNIFKWCVAVYLCLVVFIFLLSNIGKQAVQSCCFGLALLHFVCVLLTQDILNLKQHLLTLGRNHIEDILVLFLYAVLAHAGLTSTLLVFAVVVAVSVPVSLLLVPGEHPTAVLTLNLALEKRIVLCEVRILGLAIQQSLYLIKRIFRNERLVLCWVELSLPTHLARIERVSKH